MINDYSEHLKSTDNNLGVIFPITIFRYTIFRLLLFDYLTYRFTQTI